MIIKKIIIGPLKVNCYIVYDSQSKKGLIIDPGDEPEKIIKKVSGLKIVYILNTHGHFDHIGANSELKKYFKAKIGIGEDDAEMLIDPRKNYSEVLGFGQVKSPPADLLLKDNQIIKIDSLIVKVISIPGHSPGGVAYLINNKALFTGDILFKNTCGITLKKEDHQKLIKGIKEKIFPLSDEIIIYPGHGKKTTIKEARKIKFI